MALPNLHVRFDGLEQATPGMPCYDPAQPWFAHVTVINANFRTDLVPPDKFLDANNPTGKAERFYVRFEMFAGATEAHGPMHAAGYEVNGLGGYPGDGDCMVGFSVQLPKNIDYKQFGLVYGFRFTADGYSDVIESNENDNVFLWEKAQAPQMAPQWKEGEPSPFSNLKFIDFKGVPGSKRQLDVLVKNQGSETSLQLELRLTVVGPPTPASPLGTASETVSANSTAIPAGGQTWVRFSARSSFVQPLNDIPARERRRIQTGSNRRFRQVQSGPTGLAGISHLPRYLVVEKDFDFVPLKPFFIALMNSERSEKVAFGENAPAPKIRRGGRIAVPQK